MSTWAAINSGVDGGVCPAAYLTGDLLRRTWRNAERGRAQPAELLHHEPRPQQVDIGRGVQRRGRVQQQLKLPYL